MSAATSDVVIRTSKLRKVYRSGMLRRKFIGLEGLDLEVRRGEVFGYIGPNGSGKTTTIKILMGLNFATSGTAEILGKPVGSLDALRRIGFLPERPYFYDYLTAEEFLHFYGTLHDMPKRKRQQRIDELLPLVHMERARDVPLRKFSKGMLQRVGLAQALINDPELVVLDEPSSGLDPMGRTLIRDVIRQLKAKGTTVLLSSHILSDVEQVCDRVGIIAAGELKHVGRVDELVDRADRFVEVTIEGMDATAAAQLGAGEPAFAAHGHLTFTAENQADANKLLGRVIEAGGTVVSVVPRRETLEELFVEEVAGIERVEREK